MRSAQKKQATANCCPPNPKITNYEKNANQKEELSMIYTANLIIT